MLERLTFLCSGHCAEIVRALVNLERVTPRMFYNVYLHLKETGIIPKQPSKKLIKMRKTDFTIEEVLNSAWLKESDTSSEYRCDAHLKQLRPRTRHHLRQLAVIDKNSPACMDHILDLLIEKGYLTSKSLK